MEIRDTHEVERSIFSALDAVADCLRNKMQGNRIWTEKIKSALCELGRGRGHYVAASDAKGNADCGEWLFDLCWIDYLIEPENDGRQIGSIKLAVECEWLHGISNILDDFEKLLVARAHLKLIIFEVDTTAEIETIVNQLHTVTRGYAEIWPGANMDAFLLAAYTISDQKFHHARMTTARVEKFCG